MRKRPSTQPGTRFTGRAGKRRLVEVLRAQTLISGDAGLARALAGAGVLQSWSKGAELLRQGDHDNDIYLILTGEVAILVNDRQVATRPAGTHVGEMALVDPLAKRSATVRATDHTVTLHVPAHKFARLAETFPELWRRIAVEVSKRLRERNRLLRQPHAEPLVFIGSSSEGLGIATALHTYLTKKPVIPKLWTDGVFQASSTSIESLMAITTDADFAALVFTADDLTVSRGKAANSPRDNVVFELGLLMGSLGRDRVFIVKPKKVDIKVPSDLLGVTCLEYLRGGPIALPARVRSVGKRMHDHIRSLGPR